MFYIVKISANDLNNVKVRNVEKQDFVKIERTLFETYAEARQYISTNSIMQKIVNDENNEDIICVFEVK